IIRSSPNLKYFDISGNDIRDKIVEAVTYPCHELEYLDLVGSLAYNILKITGDTIIQKIEIPEIPKCSICTKDILAVSYKAFTILECGHVFHRVCIEKKIMHTVPSICPFSGCGKSVDVVDEGSRRDSVSSQTSGTSTLVGEFTRNIGIGSPRISSQDRDVDMDGNEETEHRVEESSTTFPEMNINSVNFHELNDMIIKAEDNNQKTSQDLIRSYHCFGKGYMLWFSFYDKTYSEDSSNSLVNDKIKEHIPNQDRITETTIRKRKKDDNGRVKSFSALSISKLSKDDIDYVIAKVLKANQTYLLLERAQEWSYTEFLNLHRSVILSSQPFSNDWTVLNLPWTRRFLNQAKILKSDYEAVEKQVVYYSLFVIGSSCLLLSGLGILAVIPSRVIVMVKKQSANKSLKTYWKEIIYEWEKMEAKQAHIIGSMKVYSKVAEHNAKTSISKDYSNIFPLQSKYQKFTEYLYKQEVLTEGIELSTTYNDTPNMRPRNNSQKFDIDLENEKIKFDFTVIEKELQQKPINKLVLSIYLKDLDNIR
ncbi:3984_t:CDS:10, partial [Ambispora leptoticha]